MAMYRNLDAPWDAKWLWCKENDLEKARQDSAQETSAVGSGLLLLFAHLSSSLFRKGQPQFLPQGSPSPLLCVTRSLSSRHIHQVLLLFVQGVGLETRLLGASVDDSQLKCIEGLCIQRLVHNFTFVDSFGPKLGHVCQIFARLLVPALNQ